MLIIILIIVLLIIFIVFYKYLSWNFNYWRKNDIKGPKPYIFVGTFPETSKGQLNLIEELHHIYLKWKEREKFVGVFVARKPKLFILEPKLAAEILIKNFQNFHDNESSQWTTRSVEKLRWGSPFVSIGDDWKEKRNDLTPALTANRLRAFYEIMQNSAKDMIDFIASKPSIPINTKELANRYTAQYIANFIWGIDESTFQSKQYSIIHQMANAMIMQSLDCVQYFGRTANWSWLRHFKPVRFFPLYVERFFQKMSNDIIDMRSKTKLERCDVIEHLLQLKMRKNLNDEQIAGVTTTVLIDGFETVAILIAHCLMLLARNLHVQEKLRETILSAGDNLSYDDLNNLPYLDQCIHETLRLFPPLPTLFKLCTQTFNLPKSNGEMLTLQPGDAVYISSYSFHYDPDYYINPEEFYPERFNPEYGGIQNYQKQGVFMPFGDGPRICPGIKLSLAVSKVAIVEILRNFKLLLGPNTRIDNKLAVDSFLLSIDGNIELFFQKIYNK